MAKAQNHRTVTLQELERALKVVAYCLLHLGPAVTPLLDRLEREIENAKKEDPYLRAKQILERHPRPSQALSINTPPVLEIAAPSSPFKCTTADEKQSS